MDMNLPDELKYTEEHEWVQLGEDGIATVGITEFAQSELGEIVYVEIDGLDSELSAGDTFGTVEAVKTTSDLFMPLSGTVIEFNPALDENEGDEPGLINEDPYDRGWIVKIKIADEADLSGLLDAEAYAALIG